MTCYSFWAAKIQLFFHIIKLWKLHRPNFSWYIFTSRELTCQSLSFPFLHISLPYISFSSFHLSPLETVIHSHLGVISLPLQCPDAWKGLRTVVRVQDMNTEQNSIILTSPSFRNFHLDVVEVSFIVCLPQICYNITLSLRQFVRSFKLFSVFCHHNITNAKSHLPNLKQC